jgi:pyruvate,water dikinase
MFDSYLNVSVSEIYENINKVKNSVNNARLKEYIQVNGLEQPHMAVVIQSFKEPQYAGVWIGNSDTSGVLEWVNGNGEKLVSGSSTPQTEIWNNQECQNSLKCNGKSIGETMLEYQKLVGSNADFEWMILDDKLVMLQFRPVTQKVIIDESYTINNNDGYCGIPASPGLVAGEARYLDSPDEPIVADKILLAMMTDPDWLPHLMSSKGAVTAYGGFLCHTAIVCRELGIPCVTGVGEDALDDLSKNESEQIEVNGNSGNVMILSKRKSHI